MSRRPGYGRRVGQAMADRLGILGGKRLDVSPAPKDPIPVGVAARLALLVASSDPAVDRAVVTAVSRNA